LDHSYFTVEGIKGFGRCLGSFDAGFVSWRRWTRKAKAANPTTVIARNARGFGAFEGGLDRYD